MIEEREQLGRSLGRARAELAEAELQLSEQLQLRKLQRSEQEVAVQSANRVHGMQCRGELRSPNQDLAICEVCGRRAHGGAPADLSA